MILENTEAAAEVLPSDRGNRVGVLKPSGGPGREGGCCMVWRWLSELEWDCWLSKSYSSLTMRGPRSKGDNNGGLGFNDTVNKSDFGLFYFSLKVLLGELLKP